MNRCGMWSSRRFLQNSVRNQIIDSVVQIVIKSSQLFDCIVKVGIGLHGRSNIAISVNRVCTLISCGARGHARVSVRTRVRTHPEAFRRWVIGQLGGKIGRKFSFHGVLTARCRVIPTLRCHPMFATVSRGYGQS